MFRLVLWTALILGLASVTGNTAQVLGCAGDWGTTVHSLEPQPVGPMTLSELRCLPIVQSGYRVVPSPDGSKVFSFHAIEGLWVGGINRADASHTFPGRVSSSIYRNKPVPFQWLADSVEVIGVKQHRDNHGFALGALQPFLFTNSGKETPLPSLSHKNGPLDEIVWLGDGGMAFATFGTKGAYYKPEHDDPNPTISFVNAKSGTVLEAIELASIHGLPDKKDLAMVASRVDTTGRARILAAWRPDRWMLWDQGERPRVLPFRTKTNDASYALSPDGAKVLIMANLSATGMICEFRNPCPSPTPRSGIIAELKEVDSDRLIWSISGTAYQFSSSKIPAISPDGRYGLLTIPGDTDDIALVSMTDGAVIQRFRMPGWASLTLGFTHDGRQAWIAGGATMATFNIDAPR